QTVSTAEATVEVPIIGSELAPNLVEHLEARGIEPLTEHGLEKLPDALAAVQNGRRDVVLLIEPDFAEHFTAGETARITLVHDRSNTRAGSRVQRIRGAIGSYAQQLGTLKLIARGVDPDVLTTV